MMMVAAGIGMIFFSMILCGIGVVYRRTAGRKIREELSKDYE